MENLPLFIFGKTIKFGKIPGNLAKSTVSDNFIFFQKECFWEEKSPEMRFWEIYSIFGNIFGKIFLFWESGIAKYQEVLLCVRKVTREGVKRRI